MADETKIILTVPASARMSLENPYQGSGKYELIANKTNDISTATDTETEYPSVKAVVDYVASVAPDLSGYYTIEETDVFLDEKEDVSNKVDEKSFDDLSNPSLIVVWEEHPERLVNKYPTAEYVAEGLNFVMGYVMSEMNSNLSDKADKATTLSGYGITDSYTKTEIDTMVGNIETLLGGI